MDEGSVGFLLASGVRLVATAPLRLGITSAMEVSCEQGEFRISVPPQAYGFKVTTSDKWIVDRGGEAVVDLTPGWSDRNRGRIFVGGGGDQEWINFDDGTIFPSRPKRDGSRQQWQWHDFSSELDRLSSHRRGKSATLRWHGNLLSEWMNPDVRWSVFAAKGPDQGRAAVIAAGDPGREGADIVRYYATHQAHGVVTTGEIASSNWGHPIRLSRRISG